MRDDILLEERDFFKEPFTETELSLLIGHRLVANYFSWSSPSFKTLGLTKDDLGEDELLRLMCEEPRLIRRPLISVNGELIIGTDKNAMKQVFCH